MVENCQKKFRELSHNNLKIGLKKIVKMPKFEKWNCGKIIGKFFNLFLIGSPKVILMGS